MREECLHRREDEKTVLSDWQLADARAQYTLLSAAIVGRYNHFGMGAAQHVSSKEGDEFQEGGERQHKMCVYQNSTCYEEG